MSAGPSSLFHSEPACPTALSWSALHDAAGIVGVLAGLPAEPSKPQVHNFPALVREAGGWRTALAEQGIDDLTAIMEPGIAALLAVHARGASCAAPALALWHEFFRARAALLALASPAGAGMLRAP